MTSHRLSQTIYLLFVIMYEIRYDQHNYFWSYRSYFICPFTLTTGKNDQAGLVSLSKFF